MKRMISWASLFIAFFSWMNVLMYLSGSLNLSEAKVIQYSVGAVLSTILTTALSPRTCVYDLTRYFLLGVLTWAACHTSHRIAWGIIGLAVLLLPSVMRDFRKYGRAGTGLSVMPLFALCAMVTNLVGWLVIGGVVLLLISVPGTIGQEKDRDVYKSCDPFYNAEHFILWFSLYKLILETRSSVIRSRS